MIKICCGTMAVLFASLCCAQDITPTAPKAQWLASFPFTQYSGGVMVIKAKLNNVADSLHFILDTGSGGISLDSATCAQWHIEVSPTDTVITGMGVSHKVNFAFNRSLSFPGLTVDNLNFHINDYEVLTSVYGQKIDGIIGYTFLRRYIVKINFDRLMIEVYSPGEMDYPKNGELLQPLFTALPIQSLRIEDKRKMDFNFFFDTGAGLCLLLSERFAADSGIIRNKRKPVLTQAQGMGGKLRMRLTVVKKVQLGRFKFRNVPTYLYQDVYNVTAYPFVGGLLGNDLLRRFNLIINYPNRAIHLLPNTHFNDPFDYAYTGMATYFVDGAIVVDDVIAGSPADKAGIKKDDIILSVNNNFSNNIMQYKDILQATREKIKLIIRRKDQLLQLTLKPQSIL